MADPTSLADYARRIAAPWVEVAALRTADDPWPALEAEARARLRREGPVYSLQEPDDPDAVGGEVLRWRYLSLALPTALWCAAAHDHTHPLPPAGRVSLLGPMVAPTGPVAHLHLHLGAASSFDLVWSALAVEGVPAAGDLRDSPLGHGDFARREWCALLTRALLVRRLLAEALHRAVPLAQVADAPTTLGDRLARRTALLDLLAGRIADVDGNPTLNGVIARSARPDRPARPEGGWRSPAGIWRADQLPGFGPSNHSREADLLARARERLRDGSDDPHFARALTQYVRVQCMLHRHLTCDPSAPRLARFLDVARRAMPYLTHLRSVLPVPPVGSALHISHVEARIAPSRRVLADHVDHLSRRAEEPHISLIVHLIRSTSRSLAKHVRDLTSEGQRLIRDLEARPEQLAHLRGFDLAGDELNGPLWCAASTLHALRIAADRCAARAGVQPPRLTLHVGEDGWSDLTRLRAVDAPFAWGLLRRDDRLGHALVLDDLGADPSPRQAPRWVRVFDLAWLLAQDECAGHCDAPTIRAELAAHLRAWYRWETVDPYLIWQALGLRGDLLHGLAAHDTTKPPALDRRFVFDLLHRQPDASGGTSALWTHVPAPSIAVDALDRIRERLLVRIAKWQITIEANPTSNLIVGGGRRPFVRSVWHRRATDPKESGVVPVTISTDDPLHFATDLASEYAYAHAGMLADKVPAGYAREWLEESARLSLRARFECLETAARRAALGPATSAPVK